MKKDIVGPILKQRRELCGLTIQNVVDRLAAVNINIAAKTLYGYENSHSTPGINTLVALCDIYQVADIRAAFSEGGEQHPVRWHNSQYEDYFGTSSITEKVYLLKKWGVPDFVGYESHVTSDQLLGSLSVEEQAVIRNYRLHGTDDELQLLTTYRDLNNEGKDKVQEYAADLSASGKYKKHHLDGQNSGTA